MRGFYKEHWYARVFKSTRFIGTETLSMEKFNSEKDMNSFIHKYNTEHLCFDITPSVYTMAEWASYLECLEYERSLLA